ncbi:MAG: helix-turn-helix domain-containing protein [Lentisphaeria bacterium]|nr:helix-turn-helix domain-containing protein [Lentisphaeria bacterium]
MFESFKDELLNLERLKFVSSFYCDSAIESRPATGEERRYHSEESHDHRETMIVLDGEYEVLFSGRLYRMLPGTALIIDAGEPHEGWYPDINDPGRHLWVHLLPEHFIYSLWYNDGEGYRHLNQVSAYHHYDPHGQKLIHDAWNKACESGGAPEFLAELSLRLQLRAVQIVQLQKEIESYDGYNTMKRNWLHIKRAMDYIDIQCGKECSIAKLAQLAGCSRTSFIRNFRRHAGCSVLEYVNRQRMLRYRSLLKASLHPETPTPLKECARELGFSSPQAFARWRKQHFGK